MAGESGGEEAGRVAEYDPDNLGVELQEQFILPSQDLEITSEEPVVGAEALALQELTAAYLQSVGARAVQRVTLVSEEWEELQHPMGTVYVKRWYLDILPEDNPVPGKS